MTVKQLKPCRECKCEMLDISTSALLPGWCDVICQRCGHRVVVTEGGEKLAIARWNAKRLEPLKYDFGDDQ